MKALEECFIVLSYRLFMDGVSSIKEGVQQTLLDEEGLYYKNHEEITS